MSSGLLGGLLSRGPPEQTVDEFETTARQQLAPDEQVTHRLPARNTVARGHGGEHEALGTGGSLAVVTDHRVLFVAGETVVDLPHTAIGGATLDSGLFTTVLAVEALEGSSYEFRPTDGDAAAAADYIERASDCWQFVETLLEELEGHAERIQTAIERGEFDRVEAVLGDAEETTAELGERVTAAGLDGVLGDRVERAGRALQRTRVRARVGLARKQIAGAETHHLDGERDYAGACERYERAHGHLSTARAVAREHDLDTEVVERAREQLEERVEFLLCQPVGLAKQATERALGTDDPAVRAETMRAALEHYHDALAVGWGTGLDRPYDREELRFRVALLAEGVVDARRAEAARLEAAGDTLAGNGDDEQARERYRAAIEQLDAAVDTAREFRVPDPGSAERERSWVVGKHETR